MIPQKGCQKLVSGYTSRLQMVITAKGLPFLLFNRGLIILRLQKSIRVAFPVEFGETTWNIYVELFQLLLICSLADCTTFLLKVVFPEENFLPLNKLKELERYLPEKQANIEPDGMDDDLYIYADLEDCDPTHERSHYHFIEEEDFHPSGGVQCQTS